MDIPTNSPLANVLARIAEQLARARANVAIVYTASQAQGAPSDPWLEWRGMPEYTRISEEPLQTIRIHLASNKDRDALAKVLNQQLTPQTQSVWFPPQEIAHYMSKRYVTPATVAAENIAGVAGFISIPRHDEPAPPSPDDTCAECGHPTHAEPCEVDECGCDLHADDQQN